MRLTCPAIVVALVVFPCQTRAGETEPGFRSLYNGKDLTGWRFGKEPLAGKTGTADGRFAAQGDVILIRGFTGPGPLKMEEIDTVDESGGDFTLRFEFRASRDANSGLHLRDHQFKHQLQIRDYPRVGPYKTLKKYRDNDWNAIEVVVKTNADGSGATAHCTCNGETLEDALPIPAKGPLGLQSEINTVEYRNLRIKAGK